MVTTVVLTAVFALGLPVWLLVGEVLHRLPLRPRAATKPEPGRPAHRAVPGDPAAHAA